MVLGKIQGQGKGVGKGKKQRERRWGKGEVMEAVQEDKDRAGNKSTIVRISKVGLGRKRLENEMEEGKKG